MIARRKLNIRLNSILILFLGVVCFFVLPTTVPAPPTAIQVGTNDFYSYMDEAYGMKAMPKLEMGSVVNPTLLSKHGIKAQKGDPVEIYDLVDGRVKLEFIF